MSRVQPLTRNKSGNLFADKNAYATSLLVLALDQFEMEMLEWHPRTIKMEVLDDFGVEALPQNIDKLMAAITILTTDRFHNSLPSFIWICNVLADDSFDPAIFDIATVEEMAWGITESLIISPPDDDETKPFCDEICWYISRMLDEEGVVDPPDVLRIAARRAERSDPLAAFNDDPLFYKSLYESQQAKSKDIEAVIRENMAELFNQLESLALTNGDTENLIQRLREQGSKAQ